MASSPEIPESADRPIAGVGAQATAGDVTGLTEHLFRHEAGKIVSILTGIFGIERLQWVEDVVQEAMVRALQTWPYYGVPKNPAAWLTQSAKNLALDWIRRERVFQAKQPQIQTLIELGAGNGDPSGTQAFEGEIRDNPLRLMFACCHPLIPLEAQAALALKTLCGFSPAEIARAFLTTEAAINKRLTRARQRIRELRVPFEIPSGPELGPRLEGVLQTIYLLFNEGYKASSGDRLIREDLCREAIRLATLLADNPAGDKPRVHALTALMYLNGARLPARVDASGNLLLLRDQDRSRWDRTLIARGMYHLARSASGEDLSEFHLQAGIAACHCAAPDYKSTDWRRILSLYDHLVRIDPSPVVALNRAVAVAEVDGPAAGLEAIRSIRNRQTIESYYLLHVVTGELEARLGHYPSAVCHLRKALELTDTAAERTFLSGRIREYEGLSS